LADYPIPVIYKIAGDSINAANRSTDFLCGQKKQLNWNNIDKRPVTKHTFPKLNLLDATILQNLNNI